MTHFPDVHEHCGALKAFIGGLKDEYSIYMWQRQRSPHVRVFEEDFQESRCNSPGKTQTVLGGNSKGTWKS